MDFRCWKRFSNLDNPYKEYLVDQGFHFGEWLEPDVDSMAVMQKNALIAENAIKAYRYTCLKDGKVQSDRQCEYVRPIAFV